jgi:hypothetical protein
MDQTPKNEWWKNIDPNKPKDPNKITKGTLRKAMRSKCLDDCCAGLENECRDCLVPDCTLFPFRRGPHADEPGNRTSKKNIWRAIREKCLNCSAYSWKDVATCKIPNCVLYPFRFGKALSRVTAKDVAGDPELDLELDNDPDEDDEE